MKALRGINDPTFIQIYILYNYTYYVPIGLMWYKCKVGFFKTQQKIISLVAMKKNTEKYVVGEKKYL